jgi:hypothetical protein
LGSFQNSTTTFISKSGENIGQVVDSLISAQQDVKNTSPTANSIIWLGDSTISGNTDVNNVENITRIINNVVGAKNQNILILPIFNSAYQKMNSSTVDIVKFSFPNYYYDVRTLFVKKAKGWFKKNFPSQYAAKWKSSCPQKHCTYSTQEKSTNSDWDVKNNIPPRALRSDSIHLNRYGNALLKSLLTKELIRRHWIIKA